MSCAKNIFQKIHLNEVQSFVFKSLWTSSLVIFFLKISLMKNLLYWWCHSIAYFQILKKNCSLVNKRLFLLKFSQLSAFSQKGKLCKKWNLKSIDWIKYIFKIWFNWSEKSSIVDVWLCSKYLFVNITCHLTFFRSLYIESL